MRQAHRCMAAEVGEVIHQMVGGDGGDDAVAGGCGQKKVALRR